MYTTLLWEWMNECCSSIQNSRRNTFPFQFGQLRKQHNYSRSSLFGRKHFADITWSVLCSRTTQKRKGGKSDRCSLNCISWFIIIFCFLERRPLCTLFILSLFITFLNSLLYSFMSASFSFVYCTALCNPGFCTHGTNSSYTIVWILHMTPFFMFHNTPMVERCC